MLVRSVSLLVALFFVVAARGGELQTKSFRSDVLGREVKINVLLPDGYEAEKDRRYPVVYLLHGYGGDYSEWTKADIVAEAKGLAAIIAMPEGDQSFYVNHHEDPNGRWEDYITKDVVTYVDESYRTAARRESRAISGLSMGGYGAMALGLRHPDLFASVASHSGALGVPGGIRAGEIGDRLRKIFGPEDSETRKLYDLPALARGLAKEKRPDVYIDCGAQDFLLESNRTLVAELGKLGYAYEYRETPGAHDFRYWKRNVRYSLAHQLDALKKAQAAAPAAALAAASVSGLWKVTSVLPSGEAAESTLTLRQEGEKISGRAEWATGSTDLSRGSLKEGKLVLDVDFERDGQKGMVRVEAKLDGAKLSGTWKALNEQKELIFEREWSAVLDKPGAAEKKPEASGFAAILGEWDVVVEVQGEERDYVLRLAEKEKALQATLVSPRSGDHAAKAASFKDGALRVELVRDFEGNSVTIIYEGKLAGGTLSGTMSLDGFPDFSGAFKAKRKRKPEDL